MPDRAPRLGPVLVRIVFQVKEQGSHTGIPLNHMVISRTVQCLKWTEVDTGEMYRALVFFSVQRNMVIYVNIIWFKKLYFNF